MKQFLTAKEEKFAKLNFDKRGDWLREKNETMANSELLGFASVNFSSLAFKKSSLPTDH
jgi:hypothetical protein